ncbi:tRNA (N6-threonylcarbamoyladenosine(37)-N6)-methyltransferase TrmO [Endozoicomonas ascidiicola]|uniref:tRNA (N6-threonylcarbamoyladenosine(37)-N6)-methyltransferase TrmO n=1 Tax=Endozoicomonas ascidiicola TaxID=1698521 RepID=UPI00082E4E1A|nr:tRNA (N6-threonylcarbamoyladenosine(37)-N6)-methyltransferase TrmO [Endozoicomonas ascidiicola]
MDAQLVSVGTISTPYTTLSECPFNVDEQNGALCELHIAEEYREGITGLKVGEKIDIMYWLHNSERKVSVEKSHMKNDGDESFGTFAMRTPFRPNPIGLAKLTIVEVGDGSIFVRGLDCLDGTHIVDIKPAIA